MNSLYKCLLSHFGGCESGGKSIPVYPEELIPPGPDMPCLVLKVCPAAPFEVGSVQVRCLCRIGHATGSGAALLQRSLLMEKILRRVPPDGVILHPGPGMLALLKPGRQPNAFGRENTVPPVLTGTCSFQLVLCGRIDGDD